MVATHFQASNVFYLLHSLSTLVSSSSNTYNHHPTLSLSVADMAFVLRRPFAVASCLKQVSRSPPAHAVRLFHESSSIRANNSFQHISRPSTSITSKSNSSLLGKVKTYQHAFRRTFTPEPAYSAGSGGANLTQKLIYGAAIVGGTIVATNVIFNRETREDGGMAPFERDFLNQTFLHTGLGLGIIGVTARALHQSGWSYRLMAASPWAVIIGGIAMSVGTMYATFATPPDK